MIAERRQALDKTWFWLIHIKSSSCHDPPEPVYGWLGGLIIHTHHSHCTGIEAPPLRRVPGVDGAET